MDYLVDMTGSYLNFSHGCRSIERKPLLPLTLLIEIFFSHSAPNCSITFKCFLLSTYRSIYNPCCGLVKAHIILYFYYPSTGR